MSGGQHPELERRYRRLLRAYPAGYRADRAEEILGTMLALARPGQRWPRPAEAADMLAGGLGCRARAPLSNTIRSGLSVAGPLALALAGALATVWLVFFEALPGRSFSFVDEYGLRTVPSPHTAGWPLYLPWIAALAALLLGLGRLTRALTGLAVLGQLVALILAAGTAWPLPPVYVHAVLLLLGLLALSSPAGALHLSAGAREALLLVPVLLLGQLPLRVGYPTGGEAFRYDGPWRADLMEVHLTVAVTLILALCALALARASTRWATAVPLLAGPPALLVCATGQRGTVTQVAAVAGWLVGLAALGWLTNRYTWQPQRAPGPPLPD
jgi:hypothetical protein